MSVQPWPNAPEMTQPVSVGALFRLGWGIFTRGAVWIIAPVLLATLLTNAAGRPFMAAFPWVRDLESGRMPDPEALALTGVLSGAGILMLVGLLLYAPAQLMSIRAALVAATGARPDWDSVRPVAAVQWWLWAFGLVVLTFLGAGLGFILFVIPGVWLLVRWSLALPAMVVERRGPPAALGRSYGLVAGRWWTLFGLTLVYFLVALLAGLVGAVLGPLSVVVDGVMNGLASALFVAAYLRFRAEGEGYSATALAGDLGLTRA